MACSNCGGDYVVGEGGRLECTKCGHIAGDISLLLRRELLEDSTQFPQSGNIIPEEHMIKPQRDIHQLV